MKANCKILILGEPVSARVIAERLGELGYSTVCQYSREPFRLPSIGQMNSLKILKEIFQRFAAEIAAQPDAIGMVHPGTSVWAERPELIPVARKLNLRVIGPPARIQYLFGNQLELLLEAEKLGVPNLIESWDPMYTIREVEEFLDRSGRTYPFVLRSVRGGGSFGMTVVTDENYLKRTVPTWFDQLRWNLGEVIFFIERSIEGARQVLVPFVRFRNGRSQIFPISDVSLQRRYRKVVEFCTAEFLDPKAEELLVRWTSSLIEKCNYVGMGHLEFLVDGPRVFLKSGASRLNTGFHLWEKVAGTNALAWQMAASDLQAVHPELPEDILPRDQWRSGLLAKILAEDSIFLLPRPGRVHEISVPGSPYQVILNCDERHEVTSQDSGTIAHLYTFAENFQKCVVQGSEMLKRTWIAGSLETNEKFLSELLKHSWVREGMFHSEFVDEDFIPAVRVPVAWMRLAAQAMAVPALNTSIQDRGQEQGVRWRAGDRWIDMAGPPLEWVRGPFYWAVSGQQAELPGLSGQLQVTEGDRTFRMRICVYPIEVGKWNVRFGKWFFGLRQVGAISGRIKKMKFVALVSGRVDALLFRDGTVIPPHEPVLVIESLGVFVPHSLPVSIRVTHWKVSANDLASVGQDLAEFEILSEAD